MLSGATFNAAAIAGTAVFKMVVSKDSMKNATATSHGNNRLLEASSETAFAKPVFSHAAVDAPSHQVGQFPTCPAPKQHFRPRWRGLQPAATASAGVRPTLSGE